MTADVAFVMVHLIGFALGLGGATLSDITFFRSLKSGRLTDEQYGFMITLSRVIWVGLSLLIASGLALFYLIYIENNNSLPLLSSPRWQMKLILVAIVFLNGLVFVKAIFPSIQRAVGEGLGSLRTRLWLLAGSGTVSIVSWYFIMVVSVLPRTFRPPLWQFLLVYLGLVVAGIVCSKAVMARKIS